jgi:hypothetical protein
MAANLQLIREEIWDEVPFLISRMPRQFGPSATPAEDDMGRWITTELDRTMEEFLLQDSERVLWAQRADAELPPALWARLDELIIRQTVMLGDWMEHSALVQIRIQQWKMTPPGTELYRRYNASRNKNMRILHRLEPPPIDHGWKRFKAAVVSELQLVLQDLRGHFAESRQRITAQQLMDRFRHAIAQSNCVHLQSNQLSWEAFFSAQLSSVKNLLMPGTRTSPAGLFDEWAQWTTGRSLDALRQTISKQKA